jgi:hypothetical protein
MNASMAEGVSKAASAAGVAHAVERPPRLERVGLWRALAGMAMAMMLGAAFVTVEFAVALAHRTHLMNRRIDRLSADLRQLRHVQSNTWNKLGVARVEASEGELFGKILFAPDLKTTKLGGTTESPQASGILAVSPDAGAAMLGVSGLRPLDEGKVYRIWFYPRRGVARWVDDFVVNDEGEATVAVDFPQAKSAEGTIVVTLESQDYAEEPSGPVQLKSVPPVEPRRHKK